MGIKGIENLIGEPHAIEVRQFEEDNLQEHPDGDESGQAAEASSGNRTEQSGQEQGQ